jgi:myo-inositol 2-dehydrogenase / D-chiro-inositol 1-dehydrogenase
MINVGVIGTGMIGQDHVRRMTTALSGVRVTAVTDVDGAVAASVGERIGATVHDSGASLIADPAVDAVLVCSWGPTHEEFVLASIAAGKPVFCEKPLATTQEACLRVVEAEVAHGVRLVQVGYMRRYDFAYRALKLAVDGGEIGTPQMMHCAHRNASVPPYFTPEMAITDSAVHEIDMVRWMFGTEIGAIRVLPTRGDSLFMIMEMANGVLVDVELSVRIRYGYDIRGEVVGDSGTVALGGPGPITVRREGRVATPVAADWRDRFLEAYDVELQEWVRSVDGGVLSGPSAWDGYAAAVASDAGVAALRTGDRVAVSLVDRPKLYSGVAG